MSAEVSAEDHQNKYPTENDTEYGLPPYSDQDTYPLIGSPAAASETAITPQLDGYYPAVPGSGKPSLHDRVLNIIPGLKLYYSLAQLTLTVCCAIPHN